MRFEIFISSPGDMQEEREVVAAVVEKLAAAAHIKLFCSLHPLLYERLVPPLIGRPAQHSVDLFMLRPAECDVMVCLLGHRMGTPVLDPQSNERHRSGTEYELMAATRSSRRPRPRILLYRATRPPRDPVDESQRAALEGFVREIETPGGPLSGMAPARFNDHEELRELVGRHLNEVVWGLLRPHLLKRIGQAAAALLVTIALMVGSAWAGRSGERHRQLTERQQEAENEARTVLKAARGEGWDQVAELDRLGCPAVQPLVEALAAREVQARTEETEAIARALAGIKARGHGCVLQPLRQVLGLAPSRYEFSPSVQRQMRELLADTPGASLQLSRE